MVFAHSKLMRAIEVIG